MLRESILCDDQQGMYRVTFSHVMFGLAGRHGQRPVKRQRDEPMTDTVLLFLLVSVLAR